MLVLVCTLLQCVGWLTGWRAVGQPLWAMYAMGMAEMTLMLALLFNGWCIWQRSRLELTSPLGLQAARWGFMSLLLCVLGDWVNRNFGQQYFAHDLVIEHSYLADSVWFFLPGYLLWVCLAWKVCTPAVSLNTKRLSLLLACVVGLCSWFVLVKPGTHPYTQSLTGTYSLVITAMVPAGIWLLLAFGRRAWPVATGAFLATAADALIAQFWLFGEGHYPGIAHLNFVVYFVSQALLQQLPRMLQGQTLDSPN